MDEKAYLDKEGLDYLLSKLPQPSNPNLLINPDFKINQRGKDVYPGTTIEYTVDRWTPINSNTVSVETTDNGLKGHSLTEIRSATVAQYIEYPEKYSGKTLTLSANCIEKTDMCQGWITLSVKTKGSDSWIHFAGTLFTQKGIYSYTATMPDNLTTLIVRLGFGDIRQSGTMDDYAIYSWAKLEIGDKATPFVPPDPTTELLKCQRYFMRYQNESNVDNVILFYMDPHPTSNNYANGAIFLPVKMRLSIPTVSFDNVAIKFVGKSELNNIISGTDRIVVIDPIENVVTINVNKTGVSSDRSNVLQFVIKPNGYLDFDAEIY